MSEEPSVPENQGDGTKAPLSRKPGRRGRTAAVAGSLLLAAALVVGVGYTGMTVRDADRDAGAPVREFPDGSPAEAEAADATGLAGMLVPYGTYGWNRGPDLGEFGSDVQLSGAQATALRSESLRELPRTERRELEKQLDKQRVTGMAMRSYAGKSDGAHTLSIVLARMESRATVRNLATYQIELLDSLDVFRDGPQVRGHENARCFRSPKGANEDLDFLYCFAHQGNVLITATADGVRPLDTEEAALLFAVQLDRIAEPGEAV